MRVFYYYVVSFFLLGLLYFFTFLIVVSVIFLSIFRLNKAVVATVNFWAKGTFYIVAKPLNIKGKENIDKNKKYILVANHSSAFDIMAIMSFLPGLSWLGKAGLMKIPLLKNALKAINYVPMKSSDLRNTKEMISKMVKNAGAQTIGIFPEGTRTLTGKFSKFRKGFLHVFRATETDILPVTLNGFYKFKPKGSKYMNYSSKLEVIIHEPIKRETIIEKSDEEILELTRSVISSAYKI